MNEPVLFEVKQAKENSIGVATLNSEPTLNSLTLEMIQSLSPKLDEWANDPKIAMVILQGSGSKAFCAGGDIRKLYEAMVEMKKGGSPQYAENFFEAEYKLDYKIHCYAKPILIWGHGIVMGGGLGLMAGAACRIVTESSKIAMPEITIGLYPDVGATYFLNHMPQGIGLYLGLTGTRLNATDSIFVGLADHFVESNYKEDLFKELLNRRFKTDPRINFSLLRDTVMAFEQASIENKPSKKPANELEKRLTFIQESTRHSSLQEIAAVWNHYAGDDSWIKIGLATFLKGSPTSAHVIFEQIKRGRGLSIRDAFIREAAMTVNFATNHDFQEGVRALLIDKDNKPNWQPSTLEEVSAELIEKHFRSPWAEGKNPLSNIPKEPMRGSL